MENRGLELGRELDLESVEVKEEAVERVNKGRS